MTVTMEPDNEAVRLGAGHGKVWKPPRRQRYRHHPETQLRKVIGLRYRWIRMQYVIFKYTMTGTNGKPVALDDHYKIFQKAVGSDEFGQFTSYRGKKDAVIMHLRPYRSDFTGLVGRHATEREINRYNEVEDEVFIIRDEDDDYPHTPFICFPRLNAIAVIHGSQITSNSAIARIHQIILSRTKVFATFEALREPSDLRKAVRRFNVTEVNFEILPVNPHTGRLGKFLDKSRARDHIAKIVGRAEATEAKPLVLDGGFLSAVQQLQQSGHAKVGFKGRTSRGTIVSVAKPEKPHELSESGEEIVYGEQVDIRVKFPISRLKYPFDQSHITDVRSIIRQFEKPIEDE